MGRGGYRYGRQHVPVESCHSLTAWGSWQPAQMWGEDDIDDSFEWEFSEDSCELRFTRDGREWTQTVRRTYTLCHFGGWRWWFLCPGCYRRVGRLYLPTTVYHGSERVHAFACRSCYSLTYLQRQSRDQWWTLNYRARRLERWFAYDEQEHMAYPLKWQRARTFHKRVDEYEQTIGRANSYLCARVQRFSQHYR